MSRSALLNAPASKDAGVFRTWAGSPAEVHLLGLEGWERAAIEVLLDRAAHYRAMLRAQSEESPSIPSDLWVRDLSTNHMVHARDALATTDALKARFTPQRWELFRRDVA